MDVRSVPQDAAVQLVKRAVDKVTFLVEKDAEQQFKNSEFYSLVSEINSQTVKSYSNALVIVILEQTILSIVQSKSVQSEMGS